MPAGSRPQSIAADRSLPGDATVSTAAYERFARVPSKAGVSRTMPGPHARSKQPPVARPASHKSLASLAQPSRVSAATTAPAANSSPAGFSWSSQYERRRRAAAQFGKSVFRLPIVRRVREVLLDHVREGDRVLEVGAGDRRMGELLRSQCPGVRYQSLDPDPIGSHDYTDLSQIRDTYDVVFALEVVEHLDLADLPTWLDRLHGITRPGGTLLLSTPNTFYPPAYLRDATHRTPLCYDELAGLVEAAGFRVHRIVRVYHDPVHRKLLRRYLLGWLFETLGIDFARQIVLVAQARDTAPLQEQV